MKGRRVRLPRPRSIRGRFTLTVGLLSLITLAVIGGGSHFVIHKTIEAQVFSATQRAAFDWLASMQPGRIPQPAGRPQSDPYDQVHFLQLVDTGGRVVAANDAAAGKPPLTTIRPPAHDRIQYVNECPAEGECVLVTAVRPTPQMTSLLWNGEPHYVYAGAKEPRILAGYYLKAWIAALVLLASAVVAWITWMVVGRTLRPVAAIREKVIEASAGDEILRLPEPPGDDEIARLARASNRFLDQLDELMADQRRFISLVTHELRSPVAALRAQIEEALTYPDEVDPRETLRTALHSTERFQQIIDELLAYTRITRGRTSAPEPVNLTALVRSEIDARSRARGTPIRFQATDDLIVLGTRLHLLGVLSNLLANAQRHAHSRIDVILERRGDQAVLIVQDDGDGIAPEDRERVFEPFVRLAEGLRLDPGGSGLGLAICRKAAEAHNGSLTIEDSPRGARFVLRLPLMDTRHVPARSEDGSGQPLQPTRA